MREIPTLVLSFLCLVTACGSSVEPDAGHDSGPRDAAAVDGSGDGATADAAPDASCTTDSDGDGHRSLACGGDDCDDADANAFPGNPERCDTLGHDEDCEPTTLGPDGDMDGFVSTTCCNIQPTHMTVCGLDCDDGRATANPTAVETCNGIDDDCNGMVDDHDVQFTFFHDVDNDGYGDSTMPMMACVAPLGYVLTGGDCDDVHNGVHPGAPDGPTVNCDTIDNDCDGTVDPGCPCIDGHTQMCGAVDASGHLITTAPCHPGTQTCTGAAWGPCLGAALPAPETCNMLDDDCNGLVDDGATIGCYADGDHDGYAVTGASAMMVCADSAGHCPTGFTQRAPTTMSTADCNEGSATVHPGAPELCNSIDDNCNGLVDDGARIGCYLDGDHDGYAPGGASAMSVCPDTLGHCPTGYTASAPSGATATDCNDTQATVHPGALESCNSVDDDCNGLVDDTVGTLQWRDMDGDTYGAGAPIRACVLMSGYVTSGATDCDDTNAMTHPGGQQLCVGMNDGDCDGLVGRFDTDADAWCRTRAHIEPSGSGTFCGDDHAGGSTCTLNCFRQTFMSPAYYYGDCNGDPADGCETSLITTANCITCGHACDVSTPQCCFAGLGAYADCAYSTRSDCVVPGP